MRSALYHDEEVVVVMVGDDMHTLPYPSRGRVHRIWDRYGTIVGRRRTLGAAERTESGVVGFMGDHALGTLTGCQVVR